MPRQARPRWNDRRRQWYAHIGEPGPDGRAREVYAPKSIGEKEEAAAWEWFARERERRAAVAVDPADLTAEGVAELYLLWAEGRVAEGKLTPGHYTNKEYHLGIFAEWAGARPARTLAPEDMEAFVARMQAAYSPHYVANICSSVSAAFHWAVRSKLLPGNPVAGYEAPAVPRAPERFAERAEAAAFLRFWRALADRHGRGSPRRRHERLTILLERCLIRTGARPGELCRLRWGDVRWGAGATTAGHPYAKAVLPPERHKTGGKTGKPRTIYFSPLLSRALRRELGREDRHGEAVFVHGAGRGGKGAGEPWASGSRLSKAILRVRRAAIAEARRLAEAGLPTRGLERIRDEGAERLVNYRWRHTAISTLLMMGVDAATAAELTGTSPEMIYRVYGHLLDSHLAEAAEKLTRGRKPGGN